jgi:hypothetical protein
MMEKMYNWTIRVAEYILRDPTVEFAVLAATLRRHLRSGLGFSRCEHWNYYKHQRPLWVEVIFYLK